MLWGKGFLPPFFGKEIGGWGERRSGLLSIKEKKERDYKEGKREKKRRIGGEKHGE